MIKKRIILHKIGKYPCNPYRVIAYRYIAGKITGGGGARRKWSFGPGTWIRVLESI